MQDFVHQQYVNWLFVRNLFITSFSAISLSESHTTKVHPFPAFASWVAKIEGAELPWLSLRTWKTGCSESEAMIMGGFVVVVLPILWIPLNKELVSILLRWFSFFKPWEVNNLRFPCDHTLGGGAQKPSLKLTVRPCKEAFPKKEIHLPTPVFLVLS